MQARQNQSALHDDLRRQREIAEEATRNYEAELIKHARDIEQLSSIKDTLSTLQREKNSLVKKLETANKTVASAESHYHSQKEVLEKQLKEMSDRLEDLMNQNSILHSQIDTLSAQVTRTQRPVLDVSMSSEETEEGAAVQSTERRTIDELREVVRYLRREREISDYEKEAQLQENKRIQLQLEHSSRMIDETRSQLTEERHRLENGVIVTKAEHSDMLSKINQLDLIRESNVTLREENNKNRSKLVEAEAKVKTLVAELEPLRGTLF